MNKKLSLVFFLAFISNWIWENLHSVLYFHPSGEPITQIMLAKATLFDAVLITIIGLIFILIPYLRARIWLSMVIGIVAAVVIELQALALGKCAYTASMPIIPFLNIGLTPTIQLGLLSYLIFKLLKLTEQQERSDLFICSECGFHYKERRWAEKYEAWCKDHHSCNLEITAHAEKSK